MKAPPAFADFSFGERGASPHVPWHFREPPDDCAEAAGVTRATVSLALRDHPRISAATRERITRILLARDICRAVGRVMIHPACILHFFCHHPSCQISLLRNDLQESARWTLTDRRQMKEFGCAERNPFRCPQNNNIPIYNIPTYHEKTGYPGNNVY